MPAKKKQSSLSRTKSTTTYRTGGSLSKAQSGFEGPGGGFVNRLKNEGVGSAISGSFPGRVSGVIADEYGDLGKRAVSGVKSFFGFKHGGHVQMKNGGNVPGMYKHGGMHDGMDSIKPVRGISHKSFKKK